MTMGAASVLGLIYIVSELALALKKRANADTSQVQDAGSLRWLWIVVVSSVTLAFYCRVWIPQADMGFGPVLEWPGVVLFAAGLALRWYAIVHLGRFFTVNVAIAADHRLNDTGPYRFVRHPSYTGALIAFLGIGLCLANWVSLAFLTLPILAVFVRRMRIEEAALLRAFGDGYRSYMNRTKRLIPAVY